MNVKKCGKIAPIVRREKWPEVQSPIVRVLYLTSKRPLPIYSPTCMLFHICCARCQFFFKSEEWIGGIMHQMFLISLATLLCSNIQFFENIWSPLIGRIQIQISANLVAPEKIWSATGLSECTLNTAQVHRTHILSCCTLSAEQTMPCSMLLPGLILSWLQFNCNPAPSSPAVAVDVHQVLLLDLH